MVIFKLDFGVQVTNFSHLTIAITNSYVTFLFQTNRNRFHQPGWSENSHTHNLSEHQKQIFASDERRAFFWKAAWFANLFGDSKGWLTGGIPRTFLSPWALRNFWNVLHLQNLRPKYWVSECSLRCLLASLWEDLFDRPCLLFATFSPQSHS